MSEAKTYRELKEFVNSLTEDQLNLPVIVEMADWPSMQVEDLAIQDEDFYIYDGDWEDSGTLELLKECHEDDEFDIELCTLVSEKGTPVFGVSQIMSKPIPNPERIVETDAQ
jgi:hypothetical protein